LQLCHARRRVRVISLHLCVHKRKNRNRSHSEVRRRGVFTEGQGGKSARALSHCNFEFGDRDGFRVPDRRAYRGSRAACQHKVRSSAGYWRPGQYSGPRAGVRARFRNRNFQPDARGWIRHAPA
jgi:hypothetical protein